MHSVIEDKTKAKVLLHIYILSFMMYDVCVTQELF